jgi:hypothetical protein
MLSKDVAVQLPVPELRKVYEDMIAYGQPDSVKDVRVMEAMTYWPGRKPGDVGWAYVAMSGDTFSEGIAVVVAEESGRQVIREIEWGRP